MSGDDLTRPDGLRLALGQADPPAPGKPAGWHVPLGWTGPDGVADDDTEPLRPLAALVSFHYLRSAVVRRRFFCLALAVVGLLLAGLFLLAVPPTHKASTTLVLSHDTQTDPARAMSTDVSLLASRTVAENTIDELDLAIAPEALLESVTADPTTSDVLVLTLKAPSRAEAVRRLTAFANAYLAFRAKQVTAQSNVLVQGLNDRIATLQGQLTQLSGRIEALSGAADDGSGRLSDLVTQRAQLSSQISSLQEQVQDATLRQNAVVAASRIIDPAAPDPGSGLVSVALTLMSGVIGGGALGLAVVVFQAVVSDRLRLRIEVASALDASVNASVGRLAPLPAWQRAVGFLPWIRAREIRRQTDLQRVGAMLEKSLPHRGRRQRLAVGCIDNSDEIRYGVAAAALALQRSGRTVKLVDLTERGGLDRAVDALIPAGEEKPAVWRPACVPSLATGPDDLEPGEGQGPALAMGLTGVSLVLADLDPAVGAEFLNAWTDRVVVAVTGGLSGVERVRTAGDLVRTAGLELHSALFVRAEVGDGSSGGRLAAAATSGPVPSGPVPSGAPVDAARTGPA